MKKRLGYFLIATGFLACPCHLIITLPLALALLGGTAVGSFLAGNTGLVVGLSVAYFIGAVGFGLFVLSGKKGQAEEECSTCVPEAQAPSDLTYTLSSGSRQAKEVGKL